MPYAIEMRGGKYCVVNKDTGHVKGRHSSREKAQKQMNLLRGVEHGWQPSYARNK